jgi:hypothetical protein
MASSSSRSRKAAMMAGSRVPAALRDRLGDEATFGLIELLDTERTDWSERVLSVAADRFERRLVEEVSGLRVEFRTALHEEVSSLRQQMYDGMISLRGEMHDGAVAVRQEMATTRVEMLKWSFLFWIGQVAAMAGLLAVMFKITGR